MQQITKWLHITHNFMSLNIQYCTQLIRCKL